MNPNGDDGEEETTVTGLADEGEEKAFVCETERAGGKRLLGFNLCITQHQFYKENRC